VSIFFRPLLLVRLVPPPSAHPMSPGGCSVVSLTISDIRGDGIFLIQDPLHVAVALGSQQQTTEALTPETWRYHSSALDFFDPSASSAVVLTLYAGEALIAEGAVLLANACKTPATVALHPTTGMPGVRLSLMAVITPVPMEEEEAAVEELSRSTLSARSFRRDESVLTPTTIGSQRFDGSTGTSARCGLDERFELFMGPIFTALEVWKQKPPTSEELRALHETAREEKDLFLSDLRAVCEAKRRAGQQESDLRTQIANLWQNNAALESQAAGLQSELDLMQRKLKAQERGREQQSGRLQQEIDGLTVGSYGRQASIHQLEAQVQALTLECRSLEADLDRSRTDGQAILDAHYCIGAEAEARTALLLECRAGVLDTTRFLLSAKSSTSLLLPTVPSERLPTQTSSLVHSLSHSGVLFEVDRCAAAVRREHSQQVSQTLTALRQRIEGALQACTPTISATG